MTSTPIDPGVNPDADPDSPAPAPTDPDGTGFPDDPDQAQPDIVTDPNA